MMNQQPMGNPPLLSQGDQRMQLAGLLTPRQPASAGSPLLDMSKIAQFMKMRDPTPATDQRVDTSGNVMPQNAPFGGLVNSLAGRDGLFGSNGWMARQTGTGNYGIPTTPGIEPMTGLAPGPV